MLDQIHTLSLYDGGLLGILLERCPTTTIGPLPVMQIRQNMCDALDLVDAGKQLWGTGRNKGNVAQS